jgi:hypothetical protein
MGRRDTRWPFVIFLIIRVVQAVLAFLTAALSAYVVSAAPSIWWAGMGLFIGLVALIWMGINIVLICMGLLLPITVVVIDAFCVVFFLVAMAGTGASGILQPDSCEYTIYQYTGYAYTYSTTTVPACQAAQAAFGIELFSMLGFILTLVLASITLHKNKKDLRGKKYAQGLPPISSRDPTYPSTSGQPQQQQFYANPQQQQQQPMEHYMQPIQKMSSPPPQNLQYFEPSQPAPVYSPQQEYPHQPQVYVDSSPQPVHEPISPPISPPPPNSLPPMASSANPPPQQLHAP